MKEWSNGSSVFVSTFLLNRNVIIVLCNTEFVTVLHSYQEGLTAEGLDRKQIPDSCNVLITPLF